MDIENITEDELKVIQKYYSKLSELTQKSESLRVSHSIDEAEDNNDFKLNKSNDSKCKNY